MFPIKPRLVGPVWPTRLAKTIFSDTVGDGLAGGKALGKKHKNEARTHTVVMADDHEVFRAGTRAILQNMSTMDIVAEAADGITAITFVRKLKPDLLVLDAAMPLARGIEVFAEVRRWSPDTKVMLLTGFTAPGFIADWLNAGVDGLVLKSCGTATIEEAISAVVGGASYVAPEVSQILEDRVEPKQLTHREREVMALVVTGSSNAEIAERLSISIKTVDKHRGSLMAKLDVHSIAQLMALALREGLLDELKQL
ncbi:MAG: response regulator transcription factor [Pseudomonadota bacterium]